VFDWGEWTYSSQDDNSWGNFAFRTSLKLKPWLRPCLYPPFILTIVGGGSFVQIYNMLTSNHTTHKIIQSCTNFQCKRRGQVVHERTVKTWHAAQKATLMILFRDNTIPILAYSTTLQRIIALLFSGKYTILLHAVDCSENVIWITVQKPCDFDCFIWISCGSTLNNLQGLERHNSRPVWLYFKFWYWDAHYSAFLSCLGF
jgi:hypothetical protein